MDPAYVEPVQHSGAFPAHSKDSATAGSREEGHRSSPLNLLAPDIPKADLSVDFSNFMDEAQEVEKARIENRKSNLLKLDKENEELRQELKAMNDRLEAAERKRAQLQAQDQKSEDM